MLDNLFVKILVTPENILGLIWDVAMLVGMCLIFTAWNEKWWKSLIPVYGIYLTYKHAWKGQRWLFAVQIMFEMMGVICARIMRKHITSNLFHAIRAYIETEQWDVEISVPKLLICAGLLLISMLVVFIMTRITYLKVFDSLNIHNTWLKVGTFFIPQIFLVVDYLIFKKQKNREE